MSRSANIVRCEVRICGIHSRRWVSLPAGFYLFHTRLDRWDTFAVLMYSIIKFNMLCMCAVVYRLYVSKCVDVVDSLDRRMEFIIHQHGDSVF